MEAKDTLDMGPHSASGEWLSLHHRAAVDLRRRMAEDLPLSDRAVILDAGAGSSEWLDLFKMRRPSHVIELDRRLPEHHSSTSRVQGDITRPPFRSHSFDLVWCSNVLMYVAKPAEAIRGLWRLVKPGGSMTLKEEDSGWDIILPWDEELNLAVRAAWRLITLSDPATFGDAFIGRKLPQLILAACGQNSDVRTYAKTFTFPFPEPLRLYVTAAFYEYRGRYAAILPGNEYRAMAEFIWGVNSIWQCPGMSLMLVESTCTVRSL